MNFIAYNDNSSYSIEYIRKRTCPSLSITRNKCILEEEEKFGILTCLLSNEKGVKREEEDEFDR